LVEQPDTGAAPILERLGEDLLRTGGIALEEGQKRLGGQDASMVGRALFRLLQVLLRLAVEILAVALLAPPERRNVGEVGVRLGVLAVELDDAPGGLHGLPVVAMAVLAHQLGGLLKEPPDLLLSVGLAAAVAEPARQRDEKRRHREAAATHRGTAAAGLLALLLLLVPGCRVEGDGRRARDGCRRRRARPRRGLR